MKDEKELRFLPSNGTEGMMFIEHFCDNCIHERYTHKLDAKGNYTGDDADSDQCEILTNSMSSNRPCFDKDLKLDGWEWFCGVNNGAYCDKWQKWDWGNGSNEPPEPPFYDPNQLLLFSFDEKVDELLKEQVEEMV